MATMTEEIQAIGRVLGGDVESFRFIVQRYERAVFSMIAGIVPDRHRREDIAQEVFFTAFRRLRSFDADRGSLATWLCTIARNLCLNELKKRAPALLEDLPQRPDPRRPEDELAEKELFERLDLALAELPVSQRTAFVMAEFVGLSCEEIARMEGAKAGTIRSLVSRAKAALRAKLREFAEVKHE
jgi:RNA polymerase sigma-70 factor (ECF subfamily)